MLASDNKLVASTKWSCNDPAAFFERERQDLNSLAAKISYGLVQLRSPLDAQDVFALLLHEILQFVVVLRMLCPFSFAR